METCMFDNPIFVCGKSYSECDGDFMPSTKTVLLASLAPNWAVRTHHEANATNPRGDKGTLFRNIASSYVFLFIFSEETTTNPFYLNQLGIAFAHGVSFVGIREPSYIMPNPLPEHYYSTEVVDLTKGKLNEGRSRPNTRGKSILANLLVETFRSAVVYTPDFHKPCLERLFRKVTDAYARSAKERCFPPSVTVTDHSRTSGKSGESVRQKVWTSVGGLTKCPKCGSPVKTQRKTSVLRKTNSVDHLFKMDASRTASWEQRSDAPQLVITKSVLRPIVLHSSCSKAVFQPFSRRPATSIVPRQTSSAKVGVPRDGGESRPSSSKSCNAIPDGSLSLKEAKPTEIKKENDGRDAVVNEVNNEKDKTFVGRKTSSTGFVTNKRGAFLRKMSSLPCIPTTYLVTDPMSDEPAFVHYPPANINLFDDANVPVFTDDEDKETIHISRRPSPAVSTCSTNIE